MLMFMDGFDHYGTGSAGRLAMQDNVYAEAGLGGLQCAPGVPDFGARTGGRALQFTAINGNFIRRALSAGQAEVYCGFAFYAPQLPDNNTRIAICQLRNAGNNPIISVNLTATGAIAVRSGAVNGTILGSTAGPVVGAASWNHIEVRCLRDADAGVAQVRVNGVQVLELTALALGADDIAQWCMAGNGGAGGNTEYWLDDLVFSNPSGDYNTGWNGDLRVATLFPNEDKTPSGWARVGRDVFGNGVFRTDDGCAFVEDQTLFDIAAGDFTLEFFIKLYAQPSSGEQTIAGQFDTANNQRSWRLYRDHDAGGNLKFDISTDGQVGTLTNIFNWSGWQPQLGREYFLSISRISDVTYLHIDGRQQGAGFADANTYHNSTSPLWIGNQLNGTGPSVLPAVVSRFFMDEFRFTVGTGRYGPANYAVPSAPFPRDSSDPSFADVELLFGFNDIPFEDESGNDYPVSLSSSGDPGAIDVSGDAAGKYAVVNNNPPLDATFIAADFLFATGELTLTALPAATETVTLGSTTYTFVDTLVDANDVLIGADTNATLDNLAAAINGGTGAGTVYGTGTVANTDASAQNLGDDQLRATAATQGTTGNSVASTETLASGAWTGATLTGGANIPAAQRFGFSPLPLDTTQVKGVQLYNRTRKTDAGPCNVQPSFHVGSAFENGTDRPVTTAFSYYADVFEEDPDTEAGLTPNSLTAGAFQINRTT